MKRLGVPKDAIKIEGSDNDVVITFLWAYPGQEPKERKVSFINTDLRLYPGLSIKELESLSAKSAEEELSLSRYPAKLKDILSQPDSLDFYYQKSSMVALESASEYLSLIRRAVKGVMLISPITREITPDLYIDEAVNVGKVINAFQKSKFRRIDDINAAYKSIFPKDSTFQYGWYLELWAKDQISAGKLVSEQNAAAPIVFDHTISPWVQEQLTNVENQTRFIEEIATKILKRVDVDVRNVDVSLLSPGKLFKFSYLLTIHLSTGETIKVVLKSYKFNHQKRFDKEIF
ncbi:MAG: hypothetical protein NT079_01395, partial [Candidatus Omnitrophica bacterium]|nr:hypothetical protein [Candidatus Omnitrophota bacterium]